MKNLFKIMAFTSLTLLASSCSKDILEQSPSDRPTEEVLFSSLDGAKIHLTGIYSLMNKPEGEGTRGYLISEVMGDDAVVVSAGNYGRYVGAYNYNFTTTGDPTHNFWRYNYRVISNTNLFLEKIETVSGDKEEKEDLRAQAYAIRAYSYFKLVQWFGETAYTVDPSGRGVIINNTVNSLDGYNIPRSTVGEVYAQIISDLSAAEKGIQESSYKGYLDSHGVAAIQARVYLAMGDWANASKYAKKAYKGFQLIDEATYLSGFNNVSSEDIWSQKFIDSDVNTFMSIPSFAYTSGNIAFGDNNGNGVIDVDDVNTNTRGEGFVSGYNSLRVTSKFIHSFKDTDFRKKMFPVNVSEKDGSVILEKDGTPSYSRYKTSDGCLTTKWQSRAALGTGDFSRIRASEMYLIEAEAEYHLGNIGAAKAALLVIQSRADNTVTSIDPNVDLLDQILLERRKELFLEGQRFFDLKRLDLDLDRTISADDQWSDFTHLGEPQKNILRKNSVSHRFCLPIPQKEIDANTALSDADQNSAFR